MGRLGREMDTTVTVNCLNNREADLAARCDGAVIITISTRLLEWLVTVQPDGTMQTRLTARPTALPARSSPR
jgi:hypothetical protein